MNILDWLDAHMLVFCAACGKLIFKKDAQYERTTTGATAPLCRKCHQEIFNPWSDKEEKKK
jgi:hypothetical protein